jgi:hypothetical protein
MQREGIDHDLPACRALAEGYPLQRVGELAVRFNFMRMSLRRQALLVQHEDTIFHLDSVAATALTGNLDTITNRQLWRLHVNLHPVHTRTLAYVDIHPAFIAGSIVQHENYAYCPPEAISKKALTTTDIPRRIGGTTMGGILLSIPGTT